MASRFLHALGPQASGTYAPMQVFCNCTECVGNPEPSRFFSLSAFEIHGGRQAAKQVWATVETWTMEGSSPCMHALLPGSHVMLFRIVMLQDA